jgi:hypothetical protein
MTRKKCDHNKEKRNCRVCTPTSFCIHDKRKDTCVVCTPSLLCIHDKRKSSCVVCTPSLLCIHDKRKSDCKKCSNSTTIFCIHNKRKRDCRVCTPTSFCIHDKRKDTCVVCTPAILCIHNNRKHDCKECNPTVYCIHNKRKKDCNECNPDAYCVHNKRKRDCKECNPAAFCKHDKKKYACRECGGAAFCKHDKKKYACRECSGTAFCIHNKLKRYCIICGGSHLCKSNWCDTHVKNKKYEGYCMPCFVNNPENRDKPIIRNYKTKEKDVVDNIRETFPNFTWIADKTVQDGCSKKRPDLLLDLGYQIVIIEVDENQHKNYSCDNKRTMELSRDLNHRPIIFIRFNPDDYIDKDGKKIESCWKLNTLGVIKISKKTEWNNRLTTLKNEIQKWIETKSEKTLEIVELFY